MRYHEWFTPQLHDEPPEKIDNNASGPDDPRVRPAVDNDRPSNLDIHDRDEIMGIDTRWLP